MGMGKGFDDPTATQPKAPTQGKAMFKSGQLPVPPLDDPGAFGHKMGGGSSGMKNEGSFSVGVPTGGKKEY